MPRKEIRNVVERLRASLGTQSFTLEDALGLGIGRHTLARAARAGALHRVGAGRYQVDADPLALARHHVEQLATKGIQAVVGGVTAAEIWAIGVYGSRGPLDETSTTLLIPRGTGLREGARHGIRFRVADLHPSDLAQFAGLQVTRPLRTGLDVARAYGRCRASTLVPLSSGMRAEAAWGLRAGGAISSGDITATLATHPGLARGLRHELADMAARVNSHGMAWVRRVLSDAEPLLETVLEILAWSMLTDSDLTRPYPQRWLTGASGKKYRVDFLLGDRVILEADGGIKYAEQTPWWEKQRQSDLEAAGYWVVRCTWDELLHRPYEVLARLRLALARASS